MELTIITPCMRPHFLSKVCESIDFDKIKQWIIVYDTSKNIKFEKQFSNNSKILEIECNKQTYGAGCKRMKALKLVTSGFVYFLDDDNIIHANFWNILKKVELTNFYTWNCDVIFNNTVYYGNECKVNTIDTSQFLVPVDIISKTIWKNGYCADGLFIEEIYKNNPDKLCYINEIASYYNYITKNTWNGDARFKEKSAILIKN
jgi:hypothetical protein